MVRVIIVLFLLIAASVRASSFVLPLENSLARQKTFQLPTYWLPSEYMDAELSIVQWMVFDHLEKRNYGEALQCCLNGVTLSEKYKMLRYAGLFYGYASFIYKINGMAAEAHDFACRSKSALERSGTAKEVIRASLLVAWCNPNLTIVDLQSLIENLKRNAGNDSYCNSLIPYIYNDMAMRYTLTNTGRVAESLYSQSYALADRYAQNRAKLEAALGIAKICIERGEANVGLGWIRKAEAMFSLKTTASLQGRLVFLKARALLLCHTRAGVDLLLQSYDSIARSKHATVLPQLNRERLLYEQDNYDRKLQLERQDYQIRYLEEKYHQAVLVRIVLVGLIGTILVLLLVFYDRNRKARTIIRLNTELMSVRTERFMAYIQAQEEERNRLAREIHDSIGSQVVCLQRYLSDVKVDMDKIDPQVGKSIAAIDGLVKEVYSSLREAAFNLMPRSIERAGLVEAVKELATKISFSTKLEVDFQVFGEPVRLPIAEEFAVFRITQELMANIIKHGNTSSAQVNLIFEIGNLVVQVSYEGIGFNPEELDRSKGNGWFNIQARVQQLNGQIVVDSSVDSTSTDFIVEIPLKN